AHPQPATTPPSVSLAAHFAHQVTSTVVNASEHALAPVVAPGHSLLGGLRHVVPALPHALPIPLLPNPSSPAVPTSDAPSPGTGHTFPGSLAVLLAAAAAASLVARRLRFATSVWPSPLYASLIERPG